MTPLVGAVYMWRTEVIKGSFWKKYLLFLDGDRDRLLWVKPTGQIKGHANLRQVFLNIRLAQLDKNNPRIYQSRRQFAPYSMIIPMQEIDSCTTVDQEFALTSLDELETWMKRLALVVGASYRLKQVEQSKAGRFLTSNMDGQRGSTKHNNHFRTANHSGYDPRYYPSLWETFIISEADNCHGLYDSYGHCDCSTMEEFCKYAEQPLRFTGIEFIDPCSGNIASSDNVSSSDSSWSAVFGDSGGSSWGSSCDNGFSGSSYSDSGFSGCSDSGSSSCDSGSSSCDSGSSSCDSGSSSSSCDSGSSSCDSGSSSCSSSD